MRFALQILFLAIDLPLQVLVVAGLLRGAWRRLPFLFALAVVEVVVSLVEAPAALESAFGHHSPGVPYEQVYWIGQIVIDVLMYVFVVSLLYRACERLRSARPARLTLIFGALLVAGITFLVHYDPSQMRGVWLTPWFRDLTFTSAIMDVLLWGLLLMARDKDRQLLLLSGGLGVEFAGDAIGESIRHLAIQSHSHPLALAGSLVMAAAGAFRYYTWWRALRRKAETNVRSGLAAVYEHSSL